MADSLAISPIPPSPTPNGLTCLLVDKIMLAKRERERDDDFNRYVCYVTLCVLPLKGLFL